MKNKLLSLFVIAISIMHAGCTKMLLYSYGVRNPKIENQASILNYLKENKLTIKDAYALKDTMALRAFFESGIGTPEIRFYDGNGYLMKYKDDKKCNGQNDSLISFLDPKNIIKIDSLSNIHDYLNELRTLDGSRVNKTEFNGHDYYLVMYWAKYLGKVNSVKMTDWENSLTSKSNLKIKTIKVTTDYMNFWNVEKDQMVKIYSRKTKAKANNKY